MLPYPLRNFETQKYYQNEPNFNGVYSMKSLPEIKDLGQHELIGTHWIAFYGNGDKVIYFDSSCSWAYSKRN